MTALIKSRQHRCRRVLHLIAQRSAQFARMGLNRLLGQDAPPPTLQAATSKSGRRLSSSGPYALPKGGSKRLAPAQRSRHS